MISVIVPAYNVDKYIDRCIDSIVNQTFSDFEVIIVDGNSTDGTVLREDSWLEKDDHITRILQKSKGLGPGRDEGVSCAKGEYITFIDSDDWWHPEYLEKMYSAIVEEDAEICMCDRLNYHFRKDGSIITKYPMTMPVMQDTAESFKENPEILQMLEVSVNGKLFKKGLFIDNRIKTPCCAAEDRAVIHYLFYKAKKIAKVREPLYFYHAERGGSLVNTIKAWSSMDVCLDTLNEYFKEARAKDARIDSILRNVSLDAAMAAVSSIRNMMAGGKDDEAEALIERTKGYHRSEYPDLFKKQYIIGSYGLRRETWLAYHSFDEIRVHQQFSSIISLMSKPMDAPDVHFDDSNRRTWFENDFNKSFLSLIKPAEGDYVFVDFLEERFDIGKKGDSYFTWSSLYEENEVEIKDVKRIGRLSEEADSMFEKACDAFIEKLLLVTDPSHIVLVRNRLSENHGIYSGTALFLNCDWIKAINDKLNRYYDYFTNHCPGVKVIKPSEEESFFSYEGFRFGCSPYHINDAHYHNVAYEIREMIIK